MVFFSSLRDLGAMGVGKVGAAVNVNFRQL